MADLSTTWMGLKLKSPLIIGSSGLTNSVQNIIEYEKLGVGAVVLKSLFEEQIMMEIHRTLIHEEAANQYPEALDYISNYSRHNAVSDYIKLIKDCKEKTQLPLIASINCTSASEWVDYAQAIESAGADALELNAFILPSDPGRDPLKNEKAYFDILNAVLAQVSIPVALKISFYFSGLANTIRKLSWAGAKGLVLFNRFYSPDIDIEEMRVIPSHTLSTPDEIYLPLRWMALLSGRLQCDLGASTGVHDSKGLIKMLLAGARMVEIASTVYKNGNPVISEMLDGLNNWMDRKGFAHIADFEGKMSASEVENPAAFERVQFMKYFAGIE